ncbi:MAG: hypothetical protein AAFY55_17230 [Bacteroidota bacterium]
MGHHVSYIYYYRRCEISAPLRELVRRGWSRLTSHPDQIDRYVRERKKRDLCSCVKVNYLRPNGEYDYDRGWHVDEERWRHPPHATPEHLIATLEQLPRQAQMQFETDFSVRIPITSAINEDYKRRNEEYRRERGYDPPYAYLLDELTLDTTLVLEAEYARLELYSPISGTDNYLDYSVPVRQLGADLGGATGALLSLSHTEGALFASHLRAALISRADPGIAVPWDDHPDSIALQLTAMSAPGRPSPDRPLAQLVATEDRIRAREQDAL